MATTLGTLNPFRYRGYVYDEETGQYYLRSRYYNPVWGRFINGDGQFDDNAGLLGKNLYTYCANSPIDGHDPNGTNFLSDLGSSLHYWWIKPYEDRYEAMCDDPSFYNIGNWATSGVFDTVKGAVAPKKQLSLEHWIDSAATVAMFMPLVGKALSIYDALSATRAVYPPNNGFLGSSSKTVLQPGTVVDRYGSTYGRYVTPSGTNPELLSLPPDKMGLLPETYKVLKSIKVTTGTVAPWFGQPGGGTQYLLPKKLFVLINKGVMEVLK